MFRKTLKLLRLESLIITISTVLLSCYGVLQYGNINIINTSLIVIIGISFHIIANISNDYGDFFRQANVDNRISTEDNIGVAPIYVKKLIFIISICIIICGVFLLHLLNINYSQILYLVMIAILSFILIILYTNGKHPFAYNALGDMIVFIGFGIISTLITQYVNLKEIYYDSLFLILTNGCLSSSILNLNNLRDYHIDKKINKNTLVVKYGIKSGIIFDKILITLSFFSLLIFNLLHFHDYYQFVPLCLFALLLQKKHDYNKSIQLYSIVFFLISVSCVILMMIDK